MKILVFKKLTLSGDKKLKNYKTVFLSTEKNSEKRLRICLLLSRFFFQKCFAIILKPKPCLNIQDAY
jgi:hypothetical protein